MPWYHYFCPNSGRKHSVSAPEQSLSQQLQSEKVHQGMYIDQSNEIVMPNEFWKITKEKYKQQHWDKALAKVQSISARYLDIGIDNSVFYGTRENLLWQINHLYCGNLYSVYISNNNIKQLQGLIFLRAPLLSDLDIRSNLITSIRSLRKCSFTLDHLFLEHNPLVDFRGLSQIKFNKKVKKNFVSKYIQFQTATIIFVSIYIVCNLLYIIYLSLFLRNPNIFFYPCIYNKDWRLSVQSTLFKGRVLEVQEIDFRKQI